MERDGLYLSSSVPKIQWAFNPAAPIATRLWEMFTIHNNYKLLDIVKKKLKSTFQLSCTTQLHSSIPYLKSTPSDTKCAPIQGFQIIIAESGKTNWHFLKYQETILEGYLVHVILD